MFSSAWTGDETWPSNPQNTTTLRWARVTASAIVVVSIDVDASPLSGDAHRRPSTTLDALAFVSGGHGVMESTTGCEAVDPGSIPGAPSTHTQMELVQ